MMKNIIWKIKCHSLLFVKNYVYKITPIILIMRLSKFLVLIGLDFVKFVTVLSLSYAVFYILTDFGGIGNNYLRRLSSRTEDIFLDENYSIREYPYIIEIPKPVTKKKRRCLKKKKPKVLHDPSASTLIDQDSSEENSSDEN